MRARSAKHEAKDPLSPEAPNMSEERRRAETKISVRHVTLAKPAAKQYQAGKSLTTKI